MKYKERNAFLKYIGTRKIHAILIEQILRYLVPKRDYQQNISLFFLYSQMKIQINILYFLSMFSDVAYDYKILKER